MNIADKRTPGRTAARTGLILGKFRHRALPILSGTVAIAAAFAAAGCSALGGGSAQNVALAGHTMRRHADHEQLGAGHQRHGAAATRSSP